MTGHKPGVPTAAWRWERQGGACLGLQREQACPPWTVGSSLQAWENEFLLLKATHVVIVPSATENITSHLAISRDLNKKHFPNP